MPSTASSILDLFCVPVDARLLSRLPVAPAALDLNLVMMTIMVSEIARGGCDDI
jgi:hypothetical protein